ncbi:MAG: BTAD domain-containing putative transcriptional regulator [Acidimicrobiales bacterium]
MRVRVLGPLEVVQGDRPVPLGGPKERALLAALAVNAGEVVPETRLIYALWGEEPPRTASKTLQNYVMRLRKALRAEDDTVTIETRSPGYLLSGGPETVDAVAVKDMARAARAARERGDDHMAAELLRQALGCWRGPSLAEFADQPFAMADAAHLDELRQTILEERLDAELALGRHHDCIAELESLVTVHPLRERIWGQLMTALYRDGRQADALRAYQRARQSLVEELGIEPGPALRDLERAVIEQHGSLDLVRPQGTVSWAPTGPAQLPLPTGMVRPPRTTFVGRDGQMARLLEAWQGALDGERQVVLMAGEPGIGKTTLARTFAGRVHEDGATVLFGRCDEELNVSYQPFTEALRWYVDACPVEDLGARLGDLRGELVRLVPELMGRLPDLPPPAAAEPDMERYRLFEAIADLLAAISEARPLLLVLDDLQWATKPTLLLLRHVVRRSQLSRLLIVGTYRDADVTPAHPLAETLADLRRESGVVRLDLAGLDERETVELVAARAGHGLRDEDVAFARALHVGTEGNPFFVGELLRHLVETGAVFRQGGRWVSDWTLADLELPNGVREVIGQRLSRLSAAADRVLAVACLVGPSFSLEVLERLSEAAPDPEVLLDALDEAVMAGVLYEPVRQPGLYAFSHALVHQFLRGRLTSARRARLHRRIGEVRESLADADTQLGALAYHFAEAGDTDKAVRYALRAGIRAIEQLAFEEAVSHLERGLEAVGDNPAPTGQRAELLLQIADARRKAGDVQGARAAASQAADDGRGIGSAVHLARAAMVHIALGVAGRHDPTVERLATEALGLMGQEPSALRVQVLSQLALHRALWEGRGVAAGADAQEALDLARDLGDDQVLQMALFVRAVTLVGSEQVDQRLALVDELVTMAEGEKDPRMEARGLRVRALTRLELGDLSGFDIDRERLHALAIDLRNWMYLADTIRWSGLRALLAGRFDDLDGIIAEMLARGGQDTNTLNGAACQTFFLRRDQGRLADALPLVEEGVRRAPGLVAFRALAMLAAADQGDEAGARRVLESLAVDDFADLPRDFTWPALLSSLAEVTSVLGDRERAAFVLRLFRPHAGRLVVVGWGDVCPGAVDRYLGMLYSTLERWADAEGHYEAALRLETAIDSPPLIARTQVSYARMLLRRDEQGDGARAGDLLDAALSCAGRFGILGLVAESSALLRLVTRHRDERR